MSYSTNTVPPSQSSDEDRSPLVTCGFQAVLRTLHLMSTVPLQAAPCTTPDTQGRMLLGHCCDFLGTPWQARVVSLSSYLISRSALQLFQVLLHH